VVLAEDETDLRLFPPLRAGWSLRGEPAKVTLSGGNAKRVIFGAMNLKTGTRLFLTRAKDHSAEFREFLDEIRRRYRGWHVALLLDGDSSHTAKASQRATEGMTLLWLPVRSPELLTAAQKTSSFLDPETGLGKEGSDQLRLVSKAADREVEFLMQLFQVPTHAVA
jgi:hypothetical protein